MGIINLTAPQLYRAHTRARRLQKLFGTRWAATFLMALGYSLEETLVILLLVK